MNSSADLNVKTGGGFFSHQRMGTFAGLCIFGLMGIAEGIHQINTGLDSREIVYTIGVLPLVYLMLGGFFGIGLGVCVGLLVGLFFEWLKQSGGTDEGGTDRAMLARVLHGSLWFVVAVLTLNYIVNRPAEVAKQRAAHARAVAQAEAEEAAERKRTEESRLGKHSCEGTWCTFDLGKYDRATVLSISGSRDDDVWIALDNNIVLHWNGTALTALTATTAPLTKLRAASASQVYVVAGSSLRHWNGSDWQTVDVPPFSLLSRRGEVQPRDLAVRSDGQLWLAGILVSATGKSQGFVVHYDGRTWESLLPSKLDLLPAALWVGSPQNVWVVGDTGKKGAAVWQWNGKAWAPTQGGWKHANLRAIWGRQPSLPAASQSAIWTVGAASAAFALSGRSFTFIDPNLPVAFNDLAGLDDGTVWAVGDGGIILSLQGQTWTQLPLSKNLLASLVTVYSSGKTLWIGGAWGTLLHRRN